MSLITLIILAIGLSADSFAVSVSCGLAQTRIDFFRATKIAFPLAVSQALMPLLGWLWGNEVKDIIEAYDHWLAFGLLSAIGMKMIMEGFSKKVGKKKFNPLQWKVLIWISIATSIDALVVGISFAFLDFSTHEAIIGVFTIGAVTFIASMLGILFGKKTGLSFGRKVELAGGLILIIIGVKILLEHVLF